jgi:hypothetical protein
MQLSALWCEFCNGCKKIQQLFKRPICRYCKFKMALWKLEYNGCKYYMFGFMTMPIS